MIYYRDVGSPRSYAQLGFRETWAVGFHTSSTTSGIETWSFSGRLSYVIGVIQFERPRAIFREFFTTNNGRTTRYCHVVIEPFDTTVDSITRKERTRRR